MANTQYGTDDCYVASFFSPDLPTHLRVPHYQRGYSWKQKEIDEFWDDLTSQLGIKDDYFFGTIMTIKDRDVDIASYSLVDGQQRMSTIAIFLTCIRDILFEEKSSIADEVEKEIFNIEKNQSDPLYYKIRLDDDDDRFMKDYIFKKSPNKIELVKNSPAEFETNINLKNAYDVIFTYISNEIKPKEPQEKINYLNKLRTTLRKKFVIINLQVERESKAYVLFDRMNNRGMPLETSDLIKDFIFSKIDEESKSTTGVISLPDAIKKWNDIAKKEKKYKSKLNDFLHHYLNTYHTKNENNEFSFCNKNLTYDYIDKIIEDNKMKAGELLDDLFIKHQDYFTLKHPSGSTKLSPKAQEDLVHIEKMGIKIVYPALLSGYKKYSKDDFEKLARLSLHYFFRTKTISNVNASALEIEFGKIAFMIENESANIKDVESSFVKSQYNPSDTKFEMDLSEIRLSLYSARYTLTKIVEKMQPPRINDIAPKTSLEHIMPQQPEKWTHYIKTHNKDKIAKESDLLVFHQNFKNRLGNLTIIDSVKNKVLSNDPYDDKLKEYKKSAIDITNGLTSYGIWNADSIEKRQKELAKIGREIWKI